MSHCIASRNISNIFPLQILLFNVKYFFYVAFKPIRIQLTIKILVKKLIVENGLNLMWQVKIYQVVCALKKSSPRLMVYKTDLDQNYPDNSTVHCVARNNWIFVKKLWTEHEFKWHGLYLIIRAKRMFLLSVMQKEMTSNHEVFDFTSSNSRTEQIEGSCTLGLTRLSQRSLIGIFLDVRKMFFTVSCLIETVCWEKSNIFYMILEIKPFGLEF